MDSGSYNNYDVNIFLSSTFSEEIMRDVRGSFRNEINARLNNIVGLLGGNAFVFDLQLGIPDGTDGLKTLEICFDKIKESDYFVFILSEKHGNQNTRVFLLGDENYNNHKHEDSAYSDTIRQGIDGELFIIELEVIEAEKNSELKGKRLFFFDKNAGNQDSAKRVSERIKSSCSDDDVINEFSEPFEIHNKFLEHISSVLHGEISGLSEDEKNRNLHNAGILRYNLTNTEGVKMLDDYVDNSENLPFVLYGASGSGKSALIADWLKDRPQAIYYHAGTNGSTLREMLIDMYKKHWLLFPADKQGADEKGLTDLFSGFLSDISRRGGGIIVIDGIDQLTSVNAVGKAFWLPPELPDNIKLIVSTTDDLSGRGFIIKKVPETDVIEILKGILKKEGKELEIKTVENALDGSPLAETRLPIIARLIYHEIVENFNYADIGARLSGYLRNIGSVDALYQSYLYNLEKKFGKDIVKYALALIWCSKYGIKQEYLPKMIQSLMWNDTEKTKGSIGQDDADIINEKLKVLDDLMFMLYHEFSRDNTGRLKFFHKLIDKAVKMRYCGNASEVLEFRRQIGFSMLFNANDQDRSPVAEAVYQTYECRDGVLMQMMLGKVENAAYISYNLGTDKLIEYGSIMNDPHDLVHLWRSDQGGDGWHFDYLLMAADFLRMTGYYDEALKYFQNALGYCEEHYGKDSGLALNIRNRIALATYLSGDAEKSLAMNQELLKAEAQQQGAESPESYNNIGGNYITLKEYDNALEYYNKSLSICEAQEKDSEIYAVTLSNIGYAYLCMIKSGEAARYFNMSREMNERLFGKAHINTGTCCNNIGAAYTQKGDYINALEWFKKALDIRIKVCGGNHIATATTLSNMADAEFRLYRLSDALADSLKSVEIFEKVLGNKNEKTIACYMLTSGIYSVLGDEANFEKWQKKHREATGKT